ncbi:protein-disulfide reductase DsbD family protein [Gilvimarinus sp. SDUM040013]|uniref:Protein-disulfide reductase DsbD family protein n=1 Tax=Gilvimarinus gilvus TaxID=3058038 RepID=A0ABU4S174_9GAMM|nr:protein-disulfide reductase DsbD domain-containing protein [Gilvimarinus sp. SDUM040013]MDO3385359.1 protein-disulfide reductase DsbD family protein [Gilvimarinus sp. SDUM040013]MDX6850934.1 protein-disulfide reductase DsbD family protein [Gilvimarinus sp. SDUM040013]
MPKLFALFFALLLATSVCVAQPNLGEDPLSAHGDHVKVTWLAPQSLGADGTTTLGFYFEVDPHWHVYWRNAGDSGAAPRFDITIDDAKAGPIQWPFPKRLPIEHLTNLGYEGNTAYLFEVTPQVGSQQVTLDVNLEWLVCKVDCIPGFGQMSLSLPVTPETQWREEDKTIVDTFKQRVPQRLETSPYQVTSLWPLGEQTLALSISATGQQAPDVFPLDGSLLTAREPKTIAAETGWELHFKRQPGVDLPSDTGFVISNHDQAWSAPKVPIGSAPVAAAPSQSIVLLLLAAFVGGIILNLMPCVFPVLSIKLFGLMNTTASGGARTREGLLYSAGVLATFAALGGLLLALRAGGAAIGWGFQLQSPIVVFALIVLFWLMALAFSGVFEFGHKLMTLAGHSSGGSFATGVLAVFVAAPCTGPFMGAALGAAAVLPAASAMAIFIGLGAGLAAPFLLLCVSPQLLNRLPKPGPWMDTLRQFFAFPLYATVLWLMWVLGRIMGDAGWLLAGSVLLALSFCLWLGQLGRKGLRLLASIVAIACVVFAVMQLRDNSGAEASQTSANVWQPYDQARIEQALAQGQAVFIDYTAAWCITCQVNKKLVLNTEHTTELFSQHDVLAIRADWTRHDASITEALAQLGRNSVPVYAWYAAGETTPKLLPQLLQERMITELFEPTIGDQ